MLDDLFGDPTYTDIVINIQDLERDIAMLDDDSLVDQIGPLRYNLEGKDYEKLEYIVAKNYADEDLDEEEITFLKNLYVISHCSFGILVDDEDDDVLDDE